MELQQWISTVKRDDKVLSVSFPYNSITKNAGELLFYLFKKTKTSLSVTELLEVTHKRKR